MIFIYLILTRPIEYMKKNISKVQEKSSLNTSPVWVLQTCNRLSIGGVQSFLMNFYRKIDRQKVQFAFAVQRNCELSYDQEIRSLGGRVHYLPRMEDGLLQYMRALKALLKAHPEYQIVHSHMNQRNMLSLLIAKWMGVPVRISHAHNTGFYNTFISKMRSQLLKCMIRFTSTAQWACSHAAYEHVHLHTSSPSIIHNAIEINRFLFNPQVREQIRQQFAFAQDDIVLGHIGNFSTQKNTRYLLSILSRLPERYKLLLIGEGQEKAEMEAQVRRSHEKNRVFFTGVTDSSQMLQAMDLFLFPSFFEGLGMVAIEAITNGLPVIASEWVPHDIDIVKQVWHLPIGEDSVDQWVNAILSLKHTQRTENALAVKQAGYNIAEEVKCMENMYLKFIHRAGAL